MATRRVSVAAAAKGQGADAFFSGAPAVPASESASPPPSTTWETELERATFYIERRQNVQLDELKLKRRKQGYRTDKSELVREALDALFRSEGIS